MLSVSAAEVKMRLSVYRGVGGRDSPQLVALSLLSHAKAWKDEKPTGISSGGKWPKTMTTGWKELISGLIHPDRPTVAAASISKQKNLQQERHRRNPSSSLRRKKGIYRDAHTVSWCLCFFYGKAAPRVPFFCGFSVLPTPLKHLPVWLQS
jgi:hypothetical protein